MPRPTPTGWLFLFLAILFYGAAQTSQSGLLLLLVGLALGCLIINYLVSKRAVNAVAIHPPTGELICEGDHPSQPWHIINDTKSAAGFLQAETASGPLFRIAALPAKHTKHLVPDQIFKKRGTFPLAEFRITSTCPFGLFKASRSFHLAGEVVVAPAIYVTEPPPASGFDVMLGGKFKGRRTSPSGAYFAGVRPFQQGDPLKQIHWKSSAKSQKLMVKTFEEELSGRVGFILDNGHKNEPDQLDNAVRAAGSLLFAALDEGNHAEIADLERNQPLQAPPFADAQQILDWLARLPFAPDQQVSTEQIQNLVNNISRHAALCFILTRLDSQMIEVISGLLARRRIVFIYLPAGTTHPDILSEAQFMGYTEKEIIPLS